MDLRLLEYFTTAAELEHIGKAAERLHISQSPLSRQIRQLEEELQLKLFVRERQRIHLTESGKWLLGQAQSLLAHADKIREEAAQRALGKIGTLSVAFVSSAIWSGILVKALTRFPADFPDANLELRTMRSTLQLEAMEAGRIDIGFVSIPSDSNAVETICVSEQPLLLVLPGCHPLARKRRIEPQHLEGARWIVLAHVISAERRSRFLAACAQAGFTPKIVQEVTEPSTLLGLVESGFGIGLIENSARHRAPRSLKFQTLPWLQVKSRIYMIRPRDGRQPLSDSFSAYLPKIDSPKLYLPKIAGI